MKEHPLIFSAPMIRAILDGRKSMTRRIVKPQPELSADGYRWRWKGKELGTDRPLRWLIPRRYDHGDLLWIKESYGFLLGESEAKPTLAYCATDEVPAYAKRNARFMPRWASRITLEITAVRVERLQDITEEDAEAEGVERLTHNEKTWVAIPEGTYWLGFQTLWDSLNAKRGFGWTVNPWVFVIAFRRIKP